MVVTKLQKVETTRKYELVCDQLRHKILFGDFSPGERLPSIQALSKDLGISQAVVREALRVLESEGLIETRHGSGIYTVEISLTKATIGNYLEWLGQNEDKLHQILEVRELLEGYACGLFAENATDEDIAALRINLDAQGEIIKLLSRCGDGNKPNPKELGDEFDRLAYEYHLIICSSCGNEFASEILQNILAFIFEHGEAYLYACRRPLDGFYSHQKIFKYIQRNDRHMAEKELRAHITHGRHFLPQSHQPEK